MVNRRKFILADISQIIVSHLIHTEAQLLIIIRQSLKSSCLCPKVIPLSGFHCTKFNFVEINQNNCRTLSTITLQSFWRRPTLTSTKTGPCGTSGPRTTRSPDSFIPFLNSNRNQVTKKVRRITRNKRFNDWTVIKKLFFERSTLTLVVQEIT